MTNEKMPREDKNTLLRNSIIPFFQSSYQTNIQEFRAVKIFIAQSCDRTAKTKTEFQHE